MEVSLLWRIRVRGGGAEVGGDDGVGVFVRERLSVEYARNRDLSTRMSRCDVGRYITGRKLGAETLIFGLRIDLGAHALALVLAITRAEARGTAHLLIFF